MKKLFRRLLWHILGMYLLLTLYVSLSEFELLPTHVISDPYIQYLLEIVSFVSVIAGPFFALRLFAMKRPLQAFETATTTEEQQSVYGRWALGRQYFIWGCLLCCTLIYYLSEQSSSAIYGMLILLLTNLFCLPSFKEYQKTFGLEISAKS